MVFDWSSISRQIQIHRMLPSSDIRTLFSNVSCLLMLLLFTTFHLVYFASSTVLPDHGPWRQQSRSFPSPSAEVASFPQPPPFQETPVTVAYRLTVSLGDDSSESKNTASAENRHSSAESSMMLLCPDSNELLSAEQVCDGQVHCPGGIDESKLACELHSRGRRSQFEAAEQVNILFYLAAAVSVVFYLLFILILLVHGIGVWQALKMQTSVELSSIRPSKGCLKKRKESLLQPSATVP